MNLRIHKEPQQQEENMLVGRFSLEIQYPYFFFPQIKNINLFSSLNL